MTRRVAAVFAHPDDDTYSIAGSMAGGSRSISPETQSSAARPPSCVARIVQSRAAENRLRISTVPSPNVSRRT